MDKKLKVYIVSKVEFKNILESNNINEDNVEEFGGAFISINDSSGKFFHEPFFESEHFNVIQLYFDDVERDNEFSPTNKIKTQKFNEVHGKQIIEFLKFNRRVKTIIVHCAAGISRSGAVGRFANDYLNGDNNHFKLVNSHIIPNGRVSRILNNLRNATDNIHS